MAEENKDKNESIDDVANKPYVPPADALSRTPDDLQEEAEHAAAAPSIADTTVKQPSKLKRLLKRINLYFVGFLLLIAVATAITVVNYINSQREPDTPSIANQPLDEAALRQLANTDATVGNASQTLTIQGSAVISGQTLARGNLNVAGNIQSGGSIQGSALTISGASNLNELQADNLQVATNAAIQGSITASSLSISGGATFNGPVTVPKLTVSRLVLSGNGVLEVPNHISFTGPAPARNFNPGVVGNGGSASVDGSDTAGTININSGNNPTAGCFIRITFNRAYATQPHVIISPVGAAASQTRYYVDRDSAGFSVCTTAPAPAGQVFGFDYFVTH